MEGVIHCLVDEGGRVFVQESPELPDELAVNRDRCEEYRFDLVNRRLLADRRGPHAAAVRAYLEDHLGTPDRLMKFAAEGHLAKSALADLLDLEPRKSYLAACTAIEKQYTAVCGGGKDTCLDAGCSMDPAAGEICLQPLVRAGLEYHKACAEPWIQIFRQPANRINSWQN